MANQIAANVAHETPSEAVDAVATHLRSFWAPSMRDDLTTYAKSHPDELDPLVLAALDQLQAAHTG
ncbi:MAG: formate dehydrogenase subunit delta [Actinomycetes bacterium]